uniref:Uncharacterized protein n=1 Tax=Arundo donax TaxID=35708 RepID=A0A0A8YL57_ARUDO
MWALEQSFQGVECINIVVYSQVWNTLHVMMT